MHHMIHGIYRRKYNKWHDQSLKNDNVWSMDQIITIFSFQYKVFPKEIIHKLNIIIKKKCFKEMSKTKNKCK